MDSLALVDEQIKAGRDLFERLNREEIPVNAAAWVKEGDGGQWYLYLVTPLVGEDGMTKPSYRRITPVVRRMQEEGFWIDPFEVKVVGPSDPVGEDIADIHRRYPGRMATRYGGASLGGLAIDGAYIYPALPAATV